MKGNHILSALASVSLILGCQNDTDLRVLSNAADKNSNNSNDNDSSFIAQEDDANDQSDDQSGDLNIPNVTASSQFARSCISDIFEALQSPEALCPTPIDASNTSAADEHNLCISKAPVKLNALVEELHQLFIDYLPDTLSGTTEEIAAQIAAANIPLTVIFKNDSNNPNSYHSYIQTIIPGHITDPHILDSIPSQLWMNSLGYAQCNYGEYEQENSSFGSVQLQVIRNDYELHDADDTNFIPLQTFLFQENIIPAVSNILLFWDAPELDNYDIYNSHDYNLGPTGYIHDSIADDLVDMVTLFQPEDGSSYYHITVSE